MIMTSGLNPKNIYNTKLDKKLDQQLIPTARKGLDFVSKDLYINNIANLSNTTLVSTETFIEESKRRPLLVR